MVCEHHYKIYHKEIDAYWCFGCSMMISSWFFPRDQREYAKCIAPPLWEEFTPQRWVEVSPWKYIPFELAKKHFIYFGRLFDHEYIILPVLRENTLVFYSARTVEKDRKPKYLTAKGCKKETSNRNLTPQYEERKRN